MPRPAASAALAAVSYSSAVVPHCWHQSLHRAIRPRVRSMSLRATPWATNLSPQCLSARATRSSRSVLVTALPPRHGQSFAPLYGRIGRFGSARLRRKRRDLTLWRLCCYPAGGSEQTIVQIGRGCGASSDRTEVRSDEHDSPGASRGVGGGRPVRLRSSLDLRSPAAAHHVGDRLV